MQVSTLSKLNQGQQEAVNLMLKWYQEPNQPFFLLKARGGFGKTFTVSHFLAALNPPHADVCLSAPTNNAVNHLCDGLSGYHGAVIHSLLGYYPRESATEQQFLVKGGNPNQPKPVPFKLVILDEAYYNPSVLMDAIFYNYNNIKWLFLGDYNQLPPVGESESFLKTVDNQITYQYTLSENMRASCPIQEALMDEVCDLGWEADLSPHIIKRSKATRKMMTMAENKEDFTFLSYQHKVVDSTAEFIRQCVYDYEPGTPPQAGEMVRVSGVSDIDRRALTRPNEIVTILSTTPQDIVVKRSSNEIEVLPLDFNGEVNRLKDIAIASRDPKDWKKYHIARRFYVTVSSKDSSTVHSYQGMTTNHAVIDLTDVKKCALPQLLYVAISRSRTTPSLFY